MLSRSCEAAKSVLPMTTRTSPASPSALNSTHSPLFTARTASERFATTDPTRKQQEHCRNQARSAKETDKPRHHTQGGMPQWSTTRQQAIVLRKRHDKEPQHVTPLCKRRRQQRDDFCPVFTGPSVNCSACSTSAANSQCRCLLEIVACDGEEQRERQAQRISSEFFFVWR